MIITCEQCHARYLLASLLLGVHGRKVRCGECGHTWYQEPMDEAPEAPGDFPALPEEPADVAAPVEEETPVSFADVLEAESAAAGLDPEPIPDGVRPVPEPEIKAGKRWTLPKLSWALPPGGWRAVGFSVLFLLLIGSGLMTMRNDVVQSWPPAALVYEVAGIKIPVPGEGLIFDRITARAVDDGKGTSTLTIEGSVINLRAERSILPRIRATLLDQGNLTGASWIVPVPEDEIGPETTIPFTATFLDVPGEAKEVNVRFVLN